MGKILLVYDDGMFRQKDEEDLTYEETDASDYGDLTVFRSYLNGFQVLGQNGEWISVLEKEES